MLSQTQTPQTPQPTRTPRRLVKYLGALWSFTRTLMVHYSKKKKLKRFGIQKKKINTTTKDGLWLRCVLRDSEQKVV